MNRKMVCWFMLVFFTAATAWAQYDRESDFRIEPRDSGRSAEITAYVGTRQTVRIPPRIQGLPVTAIGYRAFYEKEIISVTIPNSVTVIAEMAFEGNQLTSVIIPDSVTAIGRWAFGSNQLTSVVIPDSVTAIGSGAFGDNQLTSVVIPDSVTAIERDTFRHNQLTSVSIPDSVIINDVLAFADNPITRIIIGSNVNFNVSNYGAAQLPYNYVFHEFYNAQGHRAGTYTWSDGWSVEFR